MNLLLIPFLVTQASSFVSHDPQYLPIAIFLNFVVVAVAVIAITDQFHGPTSPQNTTNYIMSVDHIVRISRKDRVCKLLDEVWVSF